MNEDNSFEDTSLKAGAASTSTKCLNNDSNWGEICDESVLKLLDEPFDDQMNHSNLRHDENYQGFDNNAGNTWIYPNNYPLRQYQFNITKAALFRNTLVVLPTGLGKTFIAAVVMFNIYRWYPTGKIIFMAPTKPLVAQQIEACRKITGIPMKDTSEVTGKQNKKNRRELWQSKRVFFATPHVVQNDVNDSEQEFPFHDIRLIVVDEAHKARGQHPHALAVGSIASRNPNFRVLALSATPGRSVDDIIEVIRNLFISLLEIRWENSLDVVSYTFRKNIRTLVVSLGTDLMQIRNEFIDIIDPYVRYLIENNAISGSLSTLSRGSVVMEQKRFRESCTTQKHPNESQVKMNFSICVSLYHALELLERHGVRVFLNFFDDPSNVASHRYYVATNPKLRHFLEKLRQFIGPNPFLVNDQTMTNGKIPEIPDDLDFGHPKFAMVKERVLEHFQRNNDSRVIIFCEYRESVLLVYRSLLQSRPLINPRVFVGQGGTGSIRAVTQKQQLEVMEQFRSGICNTLVATSVAEEGIDIGEVDLIICFDISTRNPTRFIQRIGRTGRRRQGSIIMMVTEGKEQAMMKDVLQCKDKLNQKVVKSAEVARALYKTSPRIVPPEFNPKCIEMLMVTNTDEDKDDDGKKKSSSTNKARPTKDIKRPTRKGKGSKQVDPVLSSQNQCDVRNFFKKVDLDPEDREVFCSVRPETSSRSLLELNVTDSKSNELNRILRKIEKVKKMTIEPKKIDVGEIVRSSSIPSPIKKFVIKSNVDYVKERFEAQSAINAVTDNEACTLSNAELELQLEMKAIESVLGKDDIEKLLKEDQIVNNKDPCTDKFEGIFEGLEKRSFADNIEDFLDEKVKEIEASALDSSDESDDSSDTKIYGKHSTKYFPIVQEDEDVVLENESRYLSQIIELDRNKISGQSTPLKVKVGGLPLKDGNGPDKESLLFDCFDDDSDPFGILPPVENKENVSTHDSATKKTGSDMFDDDFDDFFADSKLNTEVENVGKRDIAPIDNSSQILEHCSPIPMLQTSGLANKDHHERTKVSSNEDLNKTASRLGIEDFDYTQFFEPFDCDDVFAVEQNMKKGEAQSDKSVEIIDATVICDNISDSLKPNSNAIPRQKSAELFSSNERTIAPLNPYQEAAAKKYISPPKCTEIKETDKSPSVLTRGVNFKRLRLTGSIRKADSLIFSKHLSMAGKSPAISNGLPKDASIMQSQADSPIVMQRKVKRILDSDSDVEEVQENQSLHASRQLIKRRKLQRRRCEFLDDEAAVSGDDCTDANMENSGLSQMQYDSIVVLDDDVEDHPDVNMKAKYLQSVRSPIKKGAFKIPAPRIYNDMSRIFSQVVPYEGNSVYKEDSFVISSDDDLVEEQVSQECPLERAEAILKARRRAKRQEKINAMTDSKFSKRKRNYQRRINILESTSSEEES